MKTVEMVEIDAGRMKAADACSQQDLEAAQQVAREVDRLRADVAAMYAYAAECGLDLSDALRERLSMGAHGLSGTRRLHGELEAIVRPA